MKVAFRTFGCQMNLNDTEIMMGLLETEGHEIVSDEKTADAVIVNTCAVREKSENKVYGKLGQLKAIKKENPSFIVGVSGCVAEKESVEILRHKEVNFVFGTRSISKINDFLKRAEKGERFIDLSDSLDEIDCGIPRHRDSKHHAWINIIYGCNKFCSYCIVPYTRGREKSRLMEDIMNEVRTVSNKGFKEITFLGQNVDSYGKDLGNGASLANLISESCKIDGVERIWYLTSYPSDFSDELIDVIAANKKVSRSVHLPVQSGNDRILKDMNRRYTRAEYLDLIDRVKRGIPDSSISTDIIVGFPGETDEEYEDTRKLIEEVRYERINLAMYSPREGTLSAKTMKDDVSHYLKAKRLNELLKIQKEINHEENLKYKGEVVRVIIEAGLNNKPGRLYGRTINNKIVIFDGNIEQIGEFANIKIEVTTAGPLYGSIV